MKSVAGRLTKTTGQGPDGTIGNGDDQTAAFQYDLAGLRTRATDALGRTMDTDYDAGGRAVQVVEDSGGLARTTEYAYDLAGRQTAITAHPVPGDGTKDQVTAYAYSVVGQLTRTTYPDDAPNSVDTWYDAGGAVTKRLDQRSIATRYFHDSAGRLTKKQDHPDSPERVETPSLEQAPRGFVWGDWAGPFWRPQQR